jgi:hypothetical protein
MKEGRKTMHFCTSTMKFLKNDWFWQKTDMLVARKTSKDLVNVYSHIDRFFDDHLRDWTNVVGVARNCPDPWPPVLAPVWVSAWRNEDEAAMFLGNLYCRKAIVRPEVWWSFSDTVLPGRPRRYIVQHHMMTPHSK